MVGGFSDPRGKRAGLGALLVGYYDDDDFVFAGKMGTGFDVELLRALRARLDQLGIDQSPFTRAEGLPRVRAHWVKPEMVVQVAFMEWTSHGKLRPPTSSAFEKTNVRVKSLGSPSDHSGLISMITIDHPIGAAKAPPRYLAPRSSNGAPHSYPRGWRAR